MNSEEVVRTYADMIYKIAFRYVRHPQDAEDVLSETFLTYFKKERVFDSEEHRKAWLIRVTVNEAKDLLSRRCYHEDLDEWYYGEKEGAYTGMDDASDLRDAILRLPEHQREVITLFYLQDLPIARIAEILDKNPNTVAVTLSRARENLRRFLENET